MDAFTDHLAIWDRLGEEDPFWAVLSDPDKRGGGWDPEAFFATGREHLDRLDVELQPWSLSFAGRRALDFGCGLGRLTQALASRAAFTIGVDASVGMVVRAQRWNREPERCAYLLNRSPDLRMLPDRAFDAIVSFIVLQHIPSPASHRYLAELARVLAPGGFLLVQVPAAEVVAPMPDGAFRADLSILDAPATIAPGETVEIAATVTNTSRETWSTKPRARLKAGNHWVPIGAGETVRDDGRVVLEQLGPGASALVRIPITGPDLPGRYRLEVDVVVEGQAWFADHGVAPAVAHLTVTPGSVPRSGPRAAEGPGGGTVAFGMWGIGREDVERMLSDAGLDVIEVAPDSSCGEEWISWRYLAVRRL